MLSASLNSLAVQVGVEKLNLFLRLEQAHLDAVLKNYPGSCLLLIGDTDRKRVKSSPVQTHFVAGEKFHSQIDVHLNSVALPFPNQSIDVLVGVHLCGQLAPEVLEEALQEMRRVLCYLGRLLIVELVPYRRLVQQFSKKLGFKKFSVLRTNFKRLPACFKKAGLVIESTHCYGFSLNQETAASSRIEQLGKRFFPFLGLGRLWVLKREEIALTPLPLAWAAPAFAFSPQMSDSCQTKATL